MERRRAIGQDQRKTMPRQRLSHLDRSKRKFDPIAILTGATEGREPKLLPLKYQRMSQGPFAFFRGAVSIMAADLAMDPHTELMVQLCGDAHLQNMGCFAGPDGRLVFDINDFDETMLGPWEWDVKRMATSIVLAGYDSEHRKSACAQAVEQFVASYIGFLDQAALQPILTTARQQIHRLARSQPVAAAFQQAERAHPCDLLAKYTERNSDGALQFRNLKSVLWRVTGVEREQVLASQDLYRRSLAPERLHWFNFFHAVDVGFKVVGTGSAGLRNYVILMEGNGSQDPLFLQIKQEVASAYAPYLSQGAHLSQGERVVDGQRQIQPFSDLLLGWTRIGEHDFLVRQLNDHKGGVDILKLRGEGLNGLAVVAGELLARGHARSGDPLTLRGYIGNGEKILRAIVDYAMAYADVTRADFAAFLKAIKDGRIPAA